MSTRAAPLPPDERRSTLVAAAIPLVVERGPRVTTREIAEAAGVAEGTIFRVFPDKDALLCAVVQAVVDPAPTVDRLRAIPEGSLDEQVTAAVKILRTRLRHVFAVMSAFGFAPPKDRPGDEPSEGRGEQPSLSAGATVVAALTDLLGPHASELRKSPGQCAVLLRTFVFAGTHPLITDGKPLSTKEIVDVLLGGIAAVPASGPASFSPALSAPDGRLFDDVLDDALRDLGSPASAQRGD